MQFHCTFPSGSSLSRPMQRNRGPAQQRRLQHWNNHRRQCHRAAAAADGSSQQPSSADASSPEQTCSSKPSVAQPHHIDPKDWDMDYFHYSPWWYKPHIVILAGASFILGSNMGAGVSIKTTIIALVPVLVLWFIFLWVVPNQFKDFAVHYIEEHPEAEQQAQEEAKARARARRGEAPDSK